MTVDKDYSRTVTCTYKGRLYYVRDNGAIYRCARDNSSPSEYDDVWTFGKKDRKSGYMFLASSVRVHQVVCAAFHGAAPLPDMVVDHIDTNRCNNRPENLRWVTRLENALDNEITRRRIIRLYGSVEAFLDNPQKVDSIYLPARLARMCTPSKAEADACRARIAEWSKNDSSLVSLNTEDKRNDYSTIRKEKLEWSPTPNAKQVGWHTPTFFPLCPTSKWSTMHDYLNNLAKGLVFAHAKVTVYGTIEKWEYDPNKDYQ